MSKFPSGGKYIENKKVFLCSIEFLGFGGILGVLNAPTPTPIPGVNVKVPIPGEKQWKNICFYLFIYDFYEKLKNNTKMITSCSIRRVGRRNRPAALLAQWEIYVCIYIYIYNRI